MPSPVVHFEIQADDLARAKAFYEKTFGWTLSKMMSEEKEGMDYWGVVTRPDGTPGINGGLYKRPADHELHTYDCTIQVDDIDTAIENVKKNGGTIRKEKMEMPGVGWFAGAVDTEGNIFGLMQATGWQPK